MTSELWLVVYAIFLVLLLVLSAFFSGYESAINSINKYQFETYFKKHKKNWTYRIVAKFLDDIQMTLSAILIGNTVVNIGATTLSTVMFTEVALLLGASDAEALGAGIATGVMTFLTLIFGEFIPKVIARRNNLFFTIKGAIPLYIFYLITWPISWVLTRMFKAKNNSTATEKELDTLVEMIEKEGVLESKEASLVKNALRFDETRITSVMTNIKKLVSVEAGAAPESIIRKFSEHRFSRLLVTQDHKYIGFITVKDFFLNYYKHQKNQQFDLAKIIKPLIYVSQYHTLDDVLQEMQIQQCHLAVVKKNENSSQVLGIITMENLMEELVGEIYDESDSTNAVTIINDFTWRVNETTNAAKFLHKHFNYHSINRKLSIKDWLKITFKIKKFTEKQKFENNDMVVTLKKNKNKNCLVFVIQKKNYYEQ